MHTLTSLRKAALALSLVILPPCAVEAALPIKNMSLPNSKKKNVEPESEYVVSFDENGMPLSLRKKKGKEQLVFSWKQNEYYARDVFVLKKPIESSDKKDKHKKHIPEQTPAESPILLPPGVDTFLGFQIPQLARDALSQVRKGGSLYREETTPEDFLKKHPIDRFTVEINRDLVKKYGIGFTSSLYKLCLEKELSNRFARERLVHNLIERPLANLGERMKRTMLLLIVPPSFDGLESAIETCKKFDIPYHIIYTPQWALFQENIATWSPALKNILSSGRDVILVGAGSTIPEMFLSFRTLGRELDVLPGKIIGLLNFSPMTTGSFLIDRLLQKGPLFISLTFDGLPGGRSQNLPADFKEKRLQSLREMQQDSICKLYDEALPSVPKSLAVLNILGIIPGNGLSNVPEIQKHQTLMRKHFIDFGANDGMFEYPGAEIPKHWNCLSYSIALNSSYMIYDGYFESYGINGVDKTWDMKSNDKIAILHGLIQTMLDLIGR